MREASNWQKVCSISIIVGDFEFKIMFEASLTEKNDINFVLGKFEIH